MTLRLRRAVKQMRIKEIEVTYKERSNLLVSHSVSHLLHQMEVSPAESRLLDIYKRVKESKYTARYTTHYSFWAKQGH